MMSEHSLWANYAGHRTTAVDNTTLVTSHTLWSKGTPLLFVWIERHCFTGHGSNFGKNNRPCINWTQKNRYFAQVLGRSTIPQWGLGFTRDVYHVISKPETSTYPISATNASAGTRNWQRALQASCGQVCCQTSPWPLPCQNQQRLWCCLIIAGTKYIFVELVWL